MEYDNRLKMSDEMKEIKKKKNGEMINKLFPEVHQREECSVRLEFIKSQIDEKISEMGEYKDRIMPDISIRALKWVRSLLDIEL